MATKNPRKTSCNQHHTNLTPHPNLIMITRTHTTGLTAVLTALALSLSTVLLVLSPTACTPTRDFLATPTGRTLSRAALTAAANYLAQRNPAVSQAMLDSLSMASIFGRADPDALNYATAQARPDPTAAQFRADYHATLSAASTEAERQALRDSVRHALTHSLRSK